MEQTGIKPMQLRLPNELRAWVKRQAIANHRSANGEITYLLEQARTKENAPTAATVDASNLQ